MSHEQKLQAPLNVPSCRRDQGSEPAQYRTAPSPHMNSDARQALLIPESSHDARVAPTPARRRSRSGIATIRTMKLAMLGSPARTTKSFPSIAQRQANAPMLVTDRKELAALRHK
ncbi:hypothetical protein [Bradyrhizobium sp. LTSP885]|uniref:hypothetical protein n=1 Tax=Bradyrhizobium sp. LTSP885 TaxID=1619232 RepID=UPI0012E06F34|nr:hypothetical protein [Bradyrhizobium sp. LTSP885]